MSLAARLMGRAFPVAVRTPITLPPGPTRGPPMFPGRSSARSVNCESLRCVRTAGVDARRFATFGLANRTAGAAGGGGGRGGAGRGGGGGRGPASPATTSVTTSAASSWSLRSPRRRPTRLQRSKASYTFITMRLRNTETNAVQPLEPQSDPVRLYVCGITPYDTTHLGHAFTYVVFDVLVRVLRAAGQPVTYMQKVTDVHDVIIRRARVFGTTWDHLADKETALYVDDMAALNVLAPDVFPRASQTIPKLIVLIVKLEAQGHAYRRDGNVYFRVGSVADYGRLSRLSRTEMITLSGQRGADPDDPRKQDPLDFVLWQASALGAPRWESPWGVGRPGWHIECSAMALEHLGPQLDVHGGGADLIYPHHDSEIAQSESATGGRPFARVWMHVGMLRFRGGRLGNSLRNLLLIRDLLAC